MNIADLTSSLPTEPPPVSFPLRVSFRVGALTITALLILVRMPEIILKGRFWAEEGRVFFALGWARSVPSALLTSYGGYLNLVANIGGILSARVMPLDYAPYATILLGLSLQLCPAILLLTSRAPWLNRPVVAAGALLLLLAVPGSEEIWLTSIEGQVHLSLCVALILALEPAGSAVGAFRLVLLALSGLSGPGAWLLTPLFALRTILDRSPRRALETVVLGAAVLLQALVFYHSLPSRALAIHPVLFLDLAFDRHVLLPFLGPAGMAHISDVLGRGAAMMQPPLWPAGATLVLTGLLASALWGHPPREPFWLLAAAALIIGVSYMGALGPLASMFSAHNGGRYSYVPQVLINLSLVALAATRRGPVGWAAIVAVAWLLTIGAINYQDPAASDKANGPAWRTEIALHRADSSHRVRIWPEHWHAVLPDDPVPPNGS